ncbi:MAG: ribonuclease PH [Sandaracinaceae bacterium]|nr:ribonuclease PH [Sandaracinaceae bacterium]
MSTRLDGRSADALRPLRIETRVQKNPEGSVMISAGNTRILVAASIDEGVPPWMRGKGSGWLTAEYAMHPRANPHRQDRDGRRGKIDGRTTEIQRLIGRALRAAVDMTKLGERQIVIDCDVLDADGGTRTASITGAFVGLALALEHLREIGAASGALRAQVAAISAGMVGGVPMLDLAYVEDSKAEVDLNVVATGDGSIVEVQGTAEGPPVPREHFDRLIDLSLGAMPALMAAQRDALSSIGIDLDALRG